MMNFTTKCLTCEKYFFVTHYCDFGRTKKDSEYEADYICVNCNNKEAIYVEKGQIAPKIAKCSACECDTLRKV